MTGMSLRPAVRRRLCARVAVAAGLVLGATAPARAQGNLSTQGFGYPPGGMSTRALGTGGATGEMDPWSTRNPASIGGLNTTTLIFQIEPEFRRVTAAGQQDRTTTSRYPLLMAVVPVRSRGMVGVSFSTFLDRTWATVVADTDMVNGEPIPSTTTRRVDGAINDIRIAGAYNATPWLRLGVAGHVLSGSNQLSLRRAFDDSTRFGAFGDTTILSFGGGAFSAGAEVLVRNVASIATSYRVGGTIRASRNDTVLSKANVPDRWGLSVAYTGIQGTAIAFRTSFDRWSRMDGLGSDDATAKDAWDSSIGADVAGPRFAGRAMPVRGGFRWRTLPFLANGKEVRERSFSLGTGLPLAANRVLLDLAVVRATRSASVSVSERAWTMSIGLSIRP